MKNIHIIPTDESLKKRGDLVQDNFGTIHIFTINDGEEYGKTTTKLHIYITSDEKIKEGDWCINLAHKQVVKPTDAEWANSNHDNLKKIILSTDQDLIKKGVQTIDDEFLEWFVKNPSCEFVEVERKHPVMIGTPNRLEGNYDYRCYKCGVIVNMIGSKCDTICNKCLVYKIAIPQESNLEKISSTELSHDFQQFINDNWDYLIGDEEPKQEWKPKEGEKVWIHVFSNWSSGKYIGYDVDKNVHLVREPEEGGGNLFASPDILPYSALPNESKQETLKEAAENYAKGWGENDDVKSFIAGVKWQAERMYSEEEVDLFIYKLIGKFTDWSGSYVYKDKLIEIYEKLKKK